MPPIVTQDLSSPEQVAHGPSHAFVVPGLLIVALLAAIDVAGGLIVGQKVAANISGTFALSPALTALSRSPRHTLTVGVPALTAAAVMAVYDQVPWGTGTVRTVVVAASVVLSALIARAQQRQWAQLQDRRQAARALQAAMLTELPRPDHLQLVSRYLPASSGDQVGGDWYDAVVDADGATVLIIGDVVGHDIHAAAAMGQLRGLLRAYAIETGPTLQGQSPAQLLCRTDEAMVRLGLDVLATVVVIRVEQEPDQTGTSRRRLRWSNAGHPPPMLLVPANRETDHVGDQSASGTESEAARTGVDDPAQVRRLRGEPDLLLGLGLGQAQRHDHVQDFPIGSTLLLYTDGLIERRDRTLDEGLDHLAHVMLAAAGALKDVAAGDGTAESQQAMTPAGPEAPAIPSRSLQRWVDAVLPAALNGGHQDDVAVLAVRAHREDRPRPPEAGPGHPCPGTPLL